MQNVCCSTGRGEEYLGEFLKNFEGVLRKKQKDNYTSNQKEIEKKFLGQVMRKYC